MKDALADLFWLVFGCLVILAIPAALIGACYGFYRYDRMECARTAEHMGLNWKHDLWAEGCYVELDGRYIPVSKIRATSDGELGDAGASSVPSSEAGQ